MELKKVATGSKEFKEGWKIYESSLPFSERRTLHGHMKIADDNRYSFFDAYENSGIIGILAAWRLDNFNFIEHLAVKKGLRGHGLGTQLMKEYLSKNPGKTVLETDRPETPVAIKRIKFYEGAGFKQNKYGYIQPSYGKGKKPVPMVLMSYPNGISEKEFSEIRKEIHKVVYGLERPLLKI